MKYDPDDPRATDLAGRIDYLRMVMMADADRLAHGFERFAKETIADPTAFSACKRISTCLRDFHSHLTQIFAVMPEPLRAAIEQSAKPAHRKTDES